MGGTALFLLSVTAYAALPLLYALWRGPARFLMLYVHLAAVLTLGGLLGAVYVLPLPGDVVLLAGQVSYGGFIFATLVAFVVGRDVQVVRNVVMLTLVVNVLVFTIFWLSHQALLSPEAIPNPLSTPIALFDQSVRVVLSGGTLIIAELLLLIGLLELAKRRLPSWAMAPFYVVAYVAIIVLDGVLFPALVIMPPSGTAALISTGVHAKLYLAAAFAVPLIIFVLAYRPTLTRFEAEPVRLRALLSVSRDELLERYDRQQAELDEQRARLTHSTALSGRAAATTSGLMRSALNTLLITTDENLVITNVSTGGVRILRRPEEQLVGKPLHSLHSPEVWRHAALEAGVAEEDARRPAGRDPGARAQRDPARLGVPHQPRHPHRLLQHHRDRRRRRGGRLPGRGRGRHRPDPGRAGGLRRARARAPGGGAAQGGRPDQGRAGQHRQPRAAHPHRERHRLPRAGDRRTVRRDHPGAARRSRADRRQRVATRAAGRRPAHRERRRGRDAPARPGRDRPARRLRVAPRPHGGALPRP